MKQFYYLVGLVLCMALSSCSKPAEPEVIPDTKVAAKTNYTLNVRHDSQKPKVVPEGLKVIVLDEETDQVITNAEVNYLWSEGFNLKSIKAININDGTYIINTNKLNKSDRITVAAEGYLPQSISKIEDPLTVKLQSGQTIKVFGKIYDHDGQEIPSASLYLRSKYPALMSKEEIQTLISCKTTSDSEGNYEIAALPVGLENLFINFIHHDYPRIDLTNNIFNTLAGDIELDLYLPRILEVEGQVKTDTGEPIANARVWAEKHDSNHIDMKFKKQIFAFHNALGYHSTLTDSNGHFNLSIMDGEQYYGIKAKTKMYQPAIAGIYTPNNPPPDFIDLVIKTEGARMMGRITNQNGLPVTNAQVSTMVYSSGSGLSITGYGINLEIESDEDGNYTSQILYAGNYDITFRAPEYKEVKKEVTILDGKVSFVDIVLPSYAPIEGVVQNPFTKKPIAGVVLSNVFAYQDLEMSPRTDADGKFWFEYKGYATMVFSHPNYVTVKKTFSRWNKNKSPYIISMSSAAAIKVNLTGLPVGKEKNYAIRLSGIKHPIIDGSAIFTNIPVHSSPITASLEGLREEKLSTSKPIELIAGETVEINMTYPAMGELVIELTQPFEKNKNSVYGNSKDRKNRIDTYRGCKIDSKRLTWESVPTNEYKLEFRNDDSSFENNFKTNFVIKAGETTKIFVDNEVENMGKILCVTKFEDSTPFGCRITAQQENSKKKHVAFTINGEFAINNLDPDLIYTLKVKLASDCIGRTNLVFKNIRPSPEAQELSLGPAYKIYGNVMDADGKPIKGVTLNKFKLEPGFFEVYPVLPGKHKIKFEAKGYEPVEKEIIIYGKDLDLGDVYLYEEEEIN